MELKRFKRKHIPDILAWVQDESQMVQWAGPGFTWPLTNKKFREYLKSADSESPTLYPFGLYRGSKIIGYCELSNYNRNCDLAIVSRVIISRKFRNKGLAQFMVIRLLEFGFTQLNLNRIGLGVFDFNKPAIKSYIPMFLHPGTLRESAKVKNEYWNCQLMSILRKEWPQKLN